MSFDKLARHYSWMERVLAGGKLQQCRTAFIDEARDAKSILLVGEGHGRFLAEVCRVNTTAPVACVDESPEMMRVAKARLVSQGLFSTRVNFHTTPILEFAPPQTYDLIVTHFFLDCFQGQELQEVIAKLASLLAPAGKWMIADFQVPERGWRRSRAQAVLALAYGFFRVSVGLQSRRLWSPAPILLSAGMRSVRRRQFNYDLLYAEIWDRDSIR